MKKSVIYALGMWLLSVFIGSVLGAVAFGVWQGEPAMIFGCIYLAAIALVISIPVFPAMIGMAYFSLDHDSGKIDSKNFLMLTPLPTVIAVLIGYVSSGWDQGLLILIPYQLATWLILGIRIMKNKKARLSTEITDIK